MAKRQIINGAWQDSLGNPLALGYLTFRLNTDSLYQGILIANAQIVAGRLVNVPLDGDGNIAGTVFLWPNDHLHPAGSTYGIRAYTTKGQEVWRCLKFSLPSGAGAFDFSSFVNS